MKQNLQKIYNVFDYHMDRIEDSFLELEKFYYNLDSLYENIEKEIEQTQIALREAKETRLLKKINSLQSKMQTVRSQKSYDSLLFQKLFSLLKELHENATNDLSENFLISKQEKFESDEFYPFLMVQNENLHFLISCKQIYWQKKIFLDELKTSRIKIKIPQLNLENSIFFFTLLEGSHKKIKAEKLAVLAQKEDLMPFGFFCDLIEEKIFLDKKLFLKNKQSIVSNEKINKEFIILKGERYFLV